MGGQNRTCCSAGKALFASSFSDKVTDITFIFHLLIQITPPCRIPHSLIYFPPKVVAGQVVIYISLAYLKHCVQCSLTTFLRAESATAIFYGQNTNWSVSAMETLNKAGYWQILNYKQVQNLRKLMARIIVLNKRWIPLGLNFVGNVLYCNVRTQLNKPKLLLLLKHWSSSNERRDSKLTVCCSWTM